ncbi:hypothetical protein CQU01_12110 [Cerasibacillus quisquiliarum]|uniref:IstB-like ATP-binding domain-containing protein n=1 Tax=Cerasibacillus quisquiliarum TaxID=227865 RepID=A0A511UZT4_9BACI|nr:hypothetical protein CQU01_12110 [Cerasibacillus quisquiliarum]
MNRFSFYHFSNFKRYIPLLQSGEKFLEEGPEDWGELLGDQGITTAILDCLLHRSEVIHLNGESHRIKYRNSIF